MTRTSCLGTANCIIFDIYFRRKEMLFFVISLNALSKSLHDQPLLDYLWDIGRDWERLQGTTTLHGRLGIAFAPFEHNMELIRIQLNSYDECELYY